MQLKSLSFWIKLIIVAVIVYFVATSITIKPAEIRDYLWYAGWTFYISLAIFTVFMAIQAGIWVAVVNDKVRQLSLIEGLLAYINSQFAKYLPGGFWNYIGRIMLAVKYGARLNTLVQALVYENVLLVLTAALYACVLVIYLHVLPVYITLVFPLLLAVPYIWYNRITLALNNNLGFLLRKLPVSLIGSLNSVNLTIGRNRLMLYLGYFMASQLVMGISYQLLISSFGIEHVGLLEATGLFAAAWLLGSLSPLPGGLGIREGALVYLLSFYTDTETALNFSVISRIWTVMAEIAFWIVLNALRVLVKKTTRVTVS